MELIKFYKRKEYLVGLIVIILNIYLILSLYVFSPNISLIITYLINLIILILFIFLCIFLESEFHNDYLKLLQLRLENKVCFFSLFAHASVVFNYFIGFSFNQRYFNYKNNCPFFLTKLDYKLHLKRRCELYNINSTKNIFQYICSFNVENDLIPMKEQNAIASISRNDINCSLVQKLINNNEVINTFINEYNKEFIYYCDLKTIPAKYGDSIDPEICQTSFFLPKYIFIINFFFLIYFCKINFTYFRIIKANAF